MSWKGLWGWIEFCRVYPISEHFFVGLCCYLTLLVVEKILLFQNVNQNIYNQVIKNEPCQNQNNTNYASISQKKRLLAKAQSECMLNVPTKQEPTDYNYLQHCSSACKEPPQVIYFLRVIQVLDLFSLIEYATYIFWSNFYTLRLYSSPYLDCVFQKYDKIFHTL